MENYIFCAVNTKVVVFFRFQSVSSIPVLNHPRMIWRPQTELPMNIRTNLTPEWSTDKQLNFLKMSSYAVLPKDLELTQCVNLVLQWSVEVYNK